MPSACRLPLATVAAAAAAAVTQRVGGTERLQCGLALSSSWLLDRVTACKQHNSLWIVSR